MPGRDVAATFVRWVSLRAAFARGYWLVTSLYLVVEADLSPFELVFVGTAQALTALVFEIPTGILADAWSRRKSVVIAHLVMGAGMLVTGLVTSFPALVATQMLWGLAWTFSSGADVAWLTDELDAPERVAGVLTAGARWDQIGAAGGLVAFGALAWASSLATAIVVSGVAMWGLGFFVLLRFSERRFTPTRGDRWRESAAIFRRGVGLARRDREIALVLAATLLVSGASDAFARLYPKRLLELGLPHEPDPIVWLTALGLVALLLAAAVLRIVEARIDGVGVARRIHASACAAGALGLLLLAFAPSAAAGMAGVLLVEGITFSVARCVGVVRVNRRTPSDVRATVQSLLGQAEYVGEIALGIGVGVLAQTTSLAAAMGGACVLMAGAVVVVARSREERSRSA